uniref:Tc1-like transposase DDE domain-containing protein n=1 Tax=Trichogramma kaykai TaxID=54128 RepID=A0ABD2WAV4_9HYME
MTPNTLPNYARTICKVWKKKLTVMEWPPQSPDLNPIELLWEELDRSIRQTRPTSKNDLWNKLQKIWQCIPKKILDALLNRMPRLCMAVIKSKGDHFDEKKI